eukprot:5369674-Prymnesium_polylepis.1
MCCDAQAGRVERGDMDMSTYVHMGNLDMHMHMHMHMHTCRHAHAHAHAHAWAWTWTWAHMHVCGLALRLVCGLHVRHGTVLLLLQVALGRRKPCELRRHAAAEAVAVQVERPQRGEVAQLRRQAAAQLTVTVRREVGEPAQPAELCRQRAAQLGVVVEHQAQVHRGQLAELRRKRAGELVVSEEVERARELVADEAQLRRQSPFEAIGVELEAQHLAKGAVNTVPRASARVRREPVARLFPAGAAGGIVQRGERADDGGARRTVGGDLSAGRSQEEEEGDERGRRPRHAADCRRAAAKINASAC